MSSPKRVIVVGGGIAGLAAAYTLQRFGFDTRILEASQRVGGRVRTAREPFSFGLHGELGAMRFPGRHVKEGLVGEFLGRFNLKRDLEPFEQRNKLLYLSGLKKPITYDDFKRRLKRKDRQLLSQFPGLLEREKGKTLDQLWAEAMKPVEAYRLKRYAYFRKKRRAKEARILADQSVRHHFDKYTLDRYLREEAGWSNDCVRLYDYCSAHVVLQNAMSESIADAFLSSEKLGAAQRMQQLKGGLDRFAHAFLESLDNDKRPLANRVRFGAKVRRVTYEPRNGGGPPITVTYQFGGGLEKEEKADYVIFSIPCPAMKAIKINPAFKLGKTRAINELRYVEVTKILAQFKTRWWERVLDEEFKMGREGGLVTDLPIRYLMFPHAKAAQSAPPQSRGVVMASYVFERDAASVGAWSEDEKQRLVADNLSGIFGPDLIDDSLEVSISHNWSNDAFAGGAAFAYFGPNQYGNLLPHLLRSDWDGRACFAGEHASDWHGWIEGALASAMRVSLQVQEHFGKHPS
jgi:monoamine oxidase